MSQTDACQIQPRMAVVATSLIVENQASLLASQLKLPLISTATHFTADHYDFILLIDSAYIALQDTKLLNTKPVYIDFLAGKNAWRQKAGGQELLAKAVGCKGANKPSIIDATAGLGRDAFVLANLGCEVLMLERSAIMALLLQDGLTRLKSHSNLDNLQLVQQDALSYLDQLSESNRPEVIYLDPMYPHRTKSALVKKEMRILRALVGDDQDALALCQQAIQKAKKRVVVKRPRIAEPLLAKPDIVFSGNNSRFDVYLINNQLYK
ncbi:MAG: SAM-dependent methyltransferase [Gammaproteobacteria bacterium]|jgi:16S rRNA (guanine1516-N2)-methyltransferase|nr:SAM-dependent methyltransferase [Gammaproteobacteria bacterium]